MNEDRRSPSIPSCLALTRLAPLLLLALLLLAVAGCADDSPGLRIKLVADPDLNTEAQVLEAIDRLELVIDRESGYRAGSDDVVLRDVDLDGEMELVFSRDVDGETSFPQLRLRRGHQSGNFTIQARGLAGRTIAAVGKRVQAKFSSSGERGLSVQLDLRDRFRPPRVLSVLPPDGAKDVPAALGYVYVVLSKWIEKASLEGNLRLTYRSSQGRKRVAGSWDLSLANTVVHGHPEERAIATLALGSCGLSPGTYELSASSRIVDADGSPLDQKPATPAKDSFTSTFTLRGTATASACSGTATCTDSSDCGSVGGQRYICLGQASGKGGRCAPAPVGCTGTGISCPGGYRCAARSSGPVCVRVLDSCKTNADCDPADPPSYVCGTGGATAGKCVPAPPACDKRVVCPAGYHCTTAAAGAPVRCVLDKPSKGDGGSVDGGIDGGDAAPSSPCAPGGLLRYTYGAKMVICSGSSSRSQCNAAAFCNRAAGWKLCTASQYLARGGKTHGQGGAWIGGCVRSGGSVSAPVAGACASCSSTLVTAATVQWSCSGTIPSSSKAANVGLASKGACYRVGANATGSAGFWAAASANMQLDRAVCCSP